MREKGLRGISLTQFYDRRWKVECTFSDGKRLFGDTLSSRKLETDVEETVMKVLLLNEYKQIRMGCQRSE